MPDTTNDPRSPIAQIIDLISGLRGDTLDQANGFADVADPFRQRRGESQDMLFRLLKDPGSFKLDPGQQFALNTGLDSVARKGNAMFGTTRSGNTAIELEKYGTGFANQAFNDRITQLMEMSGVRSGSPATAAQLLQQGRTQNNGNIASGIGALFSGPLAGIFQSIMPGIKDLFSSFFKTNGLSEQQIQDIYNDPSRAMDILQQAGISEDDLLAVINDMNGNAGLPGDYPNDPPPELTIPDIPPIDFGDPELPGIPDFGYTV